ncbi:MAG: hypothetical protein R2854_26920 [Caldilineaceae bacterium]
MAKIATALPTGAVALLLNVSGLEVLSNEDGTSIVALVRRRQPHRRCAAAPVGYTAFLLRASATGWPGPRLVGLFTAAIVGGDRRLRRAPCSPSSCGWSSGGLLVFVGLSFMVEWLIDSRRTPPRLTTRCSGSSSLASLPHSVSLEVAAGILIAALLFLVNYSRVDVVRHVASRRLRRRNSARRSTNNCWNGVDAVLAILTLQGYIFFGTAHRLLEQITARLETKACRRCAILSWTFAWSRAWTFVRAEFRPAETGDGCHDVFVVLTVFSRIQWSCLLPGSSSDGDVHRMRTMHSTGARCLP